MDFTGQVLGLVKKIPGGKVTTYGIIAKKLKTSPRAVGQALKRNKKPIIIPCHRVVRSDGHVGGYKGRENSSQKSKLLKKEGVRIEKNKIIEINKILYKWKKNLL